MRSNFYSVSGIIVLCFLSLYVNLIVSETQVDARTYDIVWNLDSVLAKDSLIP